MNDDLGMKRPSHILHLSADSAAGLAAAAGQLAVQSPHSLADFCREGNMHGTEQPFRAAIITDTAAELRTQLNALAHGETADGVLVSDGTVNDAPQTAFLFTGHGAQHVDMGRQLYEMQPVFRQAIEACAALLAGELQRPLLDILYPESDPGADSPLLTGMTYSQPAIFAIQYALTRLWQSWGIVPAIVTGHSVGEYAAACAAGVFDLADGLKLVAARGRLMDALPAKGQMVAVFANEEQVQAAITPYAEQLSIAVINGPKNVVISGEDGAVAKALTDLQALHIRARRLAVAQASHSPLVDPMLDELEGIVNAMVLAGPQTSYVSGMTGTAVNGTHLTKPAYWRQHQRLPVRFSDAMQTLFSAGFRHFLELGPDTTLLSMARRLPLPEDTAVTWLPSLSPDATWHTLLTTLGTLYVQGATVNWDAVSGG